MTKTQPQSSPGPSQPHFTNFTELYEYLQEQEALVLSLPAAATAPFRKALSKAKEVANRKLEPEFRETRRLYIDVLSTKEGVSRLAVFLGDGSTAAAGSQAMRRRQSKRKADALLSKMQLLDPTTTLTMADTTNTGEDQ